MKFVTRGATAKCQRAAEQRMRKQITKCAADDQILFDLEVLDPRFFLPPLRDVIARDHRDSTSISTFTWSFQSRSSRERFRGPPARSATVCFACSCTYLLSGPVLSPLPTNSNMYPRRCVHDTGAA